MLINLFDLHVHNKAIRSKSQQLIHFDLFDAFCCFYQECSKSLNAGISFQRKIKVTALSVSIITMLLVLFLFFFPQGHIVVLRQNVSFRPPLKILLDKSLLLHPAQRRKTKSSSCTCQYSSSCSVMPFICILIWSFILSSRKMYPCLNPSMPFSPCPSPCNLHNF